MRKQRVLIVDDHPDVAEIAAMLLDELGHHCTTATTGEAGLREAQRFRPDVAILDIGLPDISGYELARALRAERGGSIYLVAMTGWGQPEDEERAFAAGCDRHLLKPAKAGVLMEVMAAAAARGSHD